MGKQLYVVLHEDVKTAYRFSNYTDAWSWRKRHGLKNQTLVGVGEDWEPPKGWTLQPGVPF